MELRTSFIQEQRLKMNPQLYQSIRLMELPLIDLRERITEELERNPALEVLKESSTVSLDAVYTPRKEEDDYFEATSDGGFIRRNGDEASEEQRKFIEGVLSRPETLQDHLLQQLRLEPIDSETRRIGELLIQNLDENGFHKEPIALLLPDESQAHIRSAMKLIQSLEPVGTCTADYKESLRVQAGLLTDPPKGMIEALDYLELLERGKLKVAAKQLCLRLEEVEVLFERIKKLSPFPGRQFDSGDTRYVVPDVHIIRKGEGFIIRLNNEEIPVLGIHPFFMEIADKKQEKSSPDKPVRDFVRENIKEARWFIHSINQRNHTLLRVTRGILTFQRDFFLRGPKYLAPLTLRDIADELGLHETTISRAANSKYMQTEWGIFEVRHFFTNSITGSGSRGSRYSKEGVKEIIRELISDEARGFSDQEIAGILAKQGISLARRTVAKYRNELELGSSYKR
ncbi:MAG: RNA polymerase factor sigma-54 [Treponema sp.]|nr:RNA polymerase factor sigma-54 [Treponema sp.]